MHSRNNYRGLADLNSALPFFKGVGRPFWEGYIWLQFILTREKSVHIGNENRKQFSISGTPVIVASRIEQLNKKYGTQFLISGQVYHQIAKGKSQITFLAEEPLRGIGIPVEVYSVT